MKKVKRLTSEERDRAAYLFWNTERSANDIAKDFGVSRVNIWKLAQQRKHLYETLVKEELLHSSFF